MSESNQNKRHLKELMYYGFNDIRKMMIFSVLLLLAIVVSIFVYRMGLPLSCLSHACSNCNQDEVSGTNQTSVECSMDNVKRFKGFDKFIKYNRVEFGCLLIITDSHEVQLERSCVIKGAEELNCIMTQFIGKTADCTICSMNNCNV